MLNLNHSKTLQEDLNLNGTSGTKRVHKDILLQILICLNGSNSQGHILAK